MRIPVTLVFLFSILLLSAFSVETQKVAKRYQLSYPSYFGNRVFIPDDNPTTEAGVYLGRCLFYETALSANNRLSCASCHKQSLAFTDGQTFSAGVDGTLQKRNAMSLANLLWVRNPFWDGRANSLEDQAQTPLTNAHEMGQSLNVSSQKLLHKKDYPKWFAKAFGSEEITGDKIVKALAQFERTLISDNSRYDQYLRREYSPTPSEMNGMNLFYTAPDKEKGIRGADCGRCHGGPKTYSDLFENNGLDSVPEDAGREKITRQAYDRGRFRVATLRNIALTAPYMHDGRFATLEEVIDHYSDHILASQTLSPFLKDKNGAAITLQLSKEEKHDLISFLNMLTDSSFITNKTFSNPFVNESL